MQALLGYLAVKNLSIPLTVVAHFIDLSPPSVTQMVARGVELIAKMEDGY